MGKDFEDEPVEEKKGKKTSKRPVCKNCDGWGEKDGQVCPKCKGDGRV